MFCTIRLALAYYGGVKLALSYRVDLKHMRVALAITCVLMSRLAVKAESERLIPDSQQADANIVMLRVMLRDEPLDLLH